MIRAGVRACLLLFMVKSLGLSWFVLGMCFAQPGFAQASKSPLPSGNHALELAKSGRCGEAIPLLKKAISTSTDKGFRHDAGLAGVRCAMVKNQFDAADDFLRQLTRQFPDDPEVLYTAVHTYSDLATRASQQLAMRAPKSAQAHELRAESLEMQGKWDQASKEYQQILQMDPHLPGIHFKMGRLLLSEPNPPADAAHQAKKEFEQELQIDPSNAGAEYVLGELAGQAQQWDDAIQHFSRAAKLDAGFGEAFLGWGSALISVKKFPEAVAPLESAVKLEPENPAAHYNLAIAYTRTGRKQEGEREFAVHRQMIQSKQPLDTPPPQAQSAPQP
ncbi:MAG TPA: tetratricopeptide repeat protein [Terriglobales bacterium]